MLHRVARALAITSVLFAASWVDVTPSGRNTTVSAQHAQATE